MKKKTKRKINLNDYKIIISELKEDPIHKLNTAYALMSIIPLLIMTSLLAARFPIEKIFVGRDGMMFLLAIILALFGFSVAYVLLRKLIGRMLFYSAKCKKSEELKSALLAEVSHDFRSPLTAIKVGLESLLENSRTAFDEVQSKLLNICLSAVNKLAHFVSVVLDVSRLTLTKTELERELLDFISLIEEELTLVHLLVEKNEQNLLYRKNINSIQLWGDKIKLRQVVANLMSNAVKYTPTGGEIHIVVDADEGTVSLEVSNSGEGIAQSEIDKIFDKYYRIKGTDKEGVGLGLAIVKEIVELHRGTIDVFSQPGKETKFSLFLPRDLRANPRSIGTGVYK